MALSFGVLLPASGSDPPLTLSPVPVPVAMWSSWSCSCRRRRSTSWWDTGSPTRSSLTSWLLCPVCPSVRARGRWSLWWTQGHLVRLQRSASCRTCVPLREGQWVVLLMADTGSPSTPSPTTSCRACVPLREGRRVVVLEVHGAPRCQDVSMQHMAMISCFCEQRFLREVDDLVCAMWT